MDYSRCRVMHILQVKSKNEKANYYSIRGRSDDPVDNNLSSRVPAATATGFFHGHRCHVGRGETLCFPAYEVV